MTTTSLPPPTHHITTTSPTGTSTFLSPSPPNLQPISPTIQMTYLYSTPPTFSLQKDTDLLYHRSAPTKPPLRSFLPAGASVAVILDMVPNPNNEPGFLHRTQTLDYVVVLEGFMEIEPDGGEKRVVRRGGGGCAERAMHSWRNVSKAEWAKMLWSGV